MRALEEQTQAIEQLRSELVNEIVGVRVISQDTQQEVHEVQDTLNTVKDTVNRVDSTVSRTGKTSRTAEVAKQWLL